MSQQRRSDLIPKIHLFGDLILLNIAFLLGNHFIANRLINGVNEGELLQFLYLNMFWVISTYFVRTYNLFRVMRIGAVINMLIKTCVFHLFLVFSFIVIFKLELDAVRLFIIEYSLFVVFILSWRIFFVYYLKKYRAKGFNYRIIVIAGAGQIGKDLFDFFTKHPEFGYKCLGFFDDKASHENSLGKLDDLETFCKNNTVDEIYCALPDVEFKKVDEIMSFADNNFIRIKILPDFRAIKNHKVEITFYDNIPVLTLRKEPLDNIYNRFFKRAFDTTFSFLVVLLIFPWLFPIIAICIKLSSKGPVLFKQERSGRGNKPFICYKFRTMSVNSMADELQATKGDARITPIGKFLRNTSLDELPQFFNVLLGNMSVVGPRPHMLSHTAKYSKEVDQFMVRHFVKAGITGMAQISGLRGETSDPKLMEERVRWDLYYIENWSFYFDMKIIFLTVWKMLLGKINGA